jgi:hypothetical protein
MDRRRDHGSTEEPSTHILRRTSPTSYEARPSRKPNGMSMRYDRSQEIVAPSDACTARKAIPHEEDAFGVTYEGRIEPIIA